MSGGLRTSVKGNIMQIMASYGITIGAESTPHTISVTSEGEILTSPTLKRFTSDELKRATRNYRYSALLGDSPYGGVFKGWVNESSLTPTRPGTGMAIAVKKLINQDSFQAEVNYLGRLRHPNLVKLIGFCDEVDALRLVYEFMPHGSLDSHLYGRNWHILPWTLRMKTALGVAKGLAFLHSEEVKMIHRNITPSNILLDSNYNAKLSSFGIAKDCPSGDDESHVSTRVMGRYEYAAPEYIATGHLTAKYDVYSFGVVMLELLSGRPAMDKNRPAGEHSLVEWVKPYIENKRKARRIFDDRIDGQYSVAAAFKAVKLANQCISAHPKLRPTMSEVVRKLEQLQNPEDIKDRS